MNYRHEILMTILKNSNSKLKGEQEILEINEKQLDIICSELTENINMMVVSNDFNLKDVVFLKTDQEQKPRIVTGLSVRDNSITYALSCAETETYHYDFEISSEKNILI